MAGSSRWWRLPRRRPTASGSATAQCSASSRPPRRRSAPTATAAGSPPTVSGTSASTRCAASTCAGRCAAARRTRSSRRSSRAAGARAPIAEPFAGLPQRPELTMLGRTYTSGFEQDLEEWLFLRPRRTVLNPAWPWAIWYPLRRTGAFGRLSPKEQGEIIREHSILGRAYGDADLAHDVRLACHGLDVHDNDFVIGLIGRELHPLSHLVQTMRKTAQTSQYLQTLGPFFVGHVRWQSAAPR